MSEASFAGDQRVCTDRSRSLEPQLQTRLRELTTALQTTSGQLVPDETWKSLEAIAGQLASTTGGDIEWEAVANLFRFLRNAFAGSPENAEAATRNGALMESVEALVKGLCELHKKDAFSTECMVALRCGLQCLGNLVCSYPQAQDFVWTLFFTSGSPLCLAFLKSGDAKVRQYGSMGLYNCLTPERGRQLLSSVDGVSVMESLADMVANAESEWSLFTLERLLQHNDMAQAFQQLSARSRCVLLDVAVNQLMKGGAESTPSSSSITVPFLDQAQSQLLGRLRGMTKCLEEAAAGDPEISEVGKLLKVLCLASSHDGFKDFFNGGAELLATALEVLKTVHLLGKSGKNAFTPAQRLDDFTGVDKGSSELASHPSFGFKGDLVQLIGNMCHRHRSHQDLIRNLDGIPVILDVCNLDAKNPSTDATKAREAERQRKGRTGNFRGGR
ncbi:ataxin-10 isoform X2 [Haemaphysalis longicornis]